MYLMNYNRGPLQRTVLDLKNVFALAGIRDKRYCIRILFYDNTLDLYQVEMGLILIFDSFGFARYLFIDFTHIFICTYFSDVT